MAPINESFPPFNVNVTTDDIQQPTALIWVLFWVVGCLSLMTWVWIPRSLVNLFHTDEYRHGLDSTKKVKDHPSIQKGGAYWMGYWIGPVVALLFQLAFVSWTWAVYYDYSEGHTQIPRDLVGILVTVIFGFWIVSMLGAIVAHIHYLRKLSYFVIEYSGKDSKPPIILGGVSFSFDKAEEILKAQTAINGMSFLGLNALTHINIRKVIYFMSFFWGAAPFFLIWIGVTWDRSSLNDYDSHIPNVEAGLVGASGILLTFTYLIQVFYKTSNIFKYFDETGYLLRRELPSEFLESDTMRQMVNIGLSSDIAGPGSWLKGAIPIMYTHWLYKWARCFFWFAYGFLIYNDMLLAFALFALWGFLSWYLSLMAKSNSYYMTFEITCGYFTYLITYWMQILYAGQNQVDYNLILFTKFQSATYPNMEPYTTYGTSIMTVVSASFILSLLSFFQTIFSARLPDPDLSFKTN